MSLDNKISVKAVVGNIGKLISDGKITDEKPVMRVFGVAAKIRNGESDNGVWIAFLGQFEAINLLDGVEYRSGKLFLPSVASDLLEGAISSNGGKPVEFGYDISVEQNEDSSTGYIYSVVSLIEPKEDVTMSRLKKSVMAKKSAK
jgi:hypothetical protein